MPSMQSHFSSTIHQAPANPLLNLTTKICSSDSFMQEKGSCIEKDLHYYIKGICNPSQHRSFFFNKILQCKGRIYPFVEILAVLLFLLLKYREILNTPMRNQENCTSLTRLMAVLELLLPWKTFKKIILSSNLYGKWGLPEGVANSKNEVCLLIKTCTKSITVIQVCIF